MVYKPLRLLFLTVLLLTTSQVSLHAQRTLGIFWDIPENQQAAVKQLQQFRELGISLIEVRERPAAEVWKQINKLGFEVYGNLGIRFPITPTFEEPDSLFINSIEADASAFLSQPSVQALGLFEFGAVHKARFLQAVEPFITQLQRAGDAEIYYVSGSIPPKDSTAADFLIYSEQITPENISSFALPEKSEINAYRYSPSEGLGNYLRPFYQFLDAASPKKAIFLDSSWLFTLVEKYPNFRETLRSLAADPHPVFPVPDESLPQQNDSAMPILVLLAAWGSAALLYSSSPLYRKSLFRYFTGHKFFLKDIFARHFRSSIPAAVIIFQNALLLSVSTYTAFLALFSPLGQKAFFYHFPSITIFGSGGFSLFILVFLGILALSFVNIVWLYGLHKNLNSITQIATIYAWPLQINLILSAIAIAVFSAEGNIFLVAGFTLSAFVIFLISFTFASADAAGFLGAKKQLYLAGTSGIYFILLGALISWMITKEELWEVISLALSLK